VTQDNDLMNPNKIIGRIIRPYWDLTPSDASIPTVQCSALITDFKRKRDLASGVLVAEQPFAGAIIGQVQQEAMSHGVMKDQDKEQMKAQIEEATGRAKKKEGELLEVRSVLEATTKERDGWKRLSEEYEKIIPPNQPKKKRLGSNGGYVADVEEG